MASDDVRSEILLATAEALLDDRRLDRAVEYFHKAEFRGANPDRCAAGRWMSAMLKGDFAWAWRESDAIRERGTSDENRVWQGDDLTGKRVVVRCLHGFGDTVQFARYAPMLNRLAASVIWEIDPAMFHIASCFAEVKHVIAWGNDCIAGRDWDVQIEVMELPYIFRTTITDLPVAEKYTRVPSMTIRHVASEMGLSNRSRVGLVWSAGAWNESRSIPFHKLRPLFETKCCEFWNLQGGPSRYLGRSAIGRAVFRESPSCNKGILCLAGVISELDLVLTVDTLAAHLAGSLGVPVWLMLQHASDWRWMEDRDDSPWYPSMRIFRQPRPGAWTEMVDDISNALQIWLQDEQRRSA